jgi:formate-dependent nitrite reductase membrane component NrfD
MENVTASKDKEAMKHELENSTLNPAEISFAGESRKKSVEILMERAKASRVYDTPDKGILWGWEVSAYILTKAIASGVILIPFIGMLLRIDGISDTIQYISGIISVVFLLLTGILLVKDLDQPKRFLYVLLRPQWNSWLTRGGYAITLMGGFTTFWLLGKYFGIGFLSNIFLWLAAIMALIVAVYTAFLFAQAKGRDFWQSPVLVLHMMIHSFMAGSAAFTILFAMVQPATELITFTHTVLAGSIIINLLLMVIELSITHPTLDAKKVVEMILSGRYSRLFWLGAIMLGNLLPLVIVFAFPTLVIAACIFSLLGIFITEKIWVEAPQRIPLT